VVELDANGNIPRLDTLCRVYHVAGIDNGKPWSGLNIWSGDLYWKDKIEAYDTFRGWATPEISGAQRSTQPSEDFGRGLPVRIRIALCQRADGTRYLELWSSETHDSQTRREQSRSFVAWVTDTLDPLPPLPAPTVLSLSEEVAVMAVQSGPLDQRQRDILVGIAEKLKGSGE
jgi:hypothetical protein